VIVPLLVPLTEMLTPGTGEPSSEEVTFPVTCLVCAATCPIRAKNNTVLISNSFLMFVFSFNYLMENSFAQQLQAVVNLITRKFDFIYCIWAFGL
jgi:hypothetical protein